MHKIVVLDHPRENSGELDWSPLSDLGAVDFYDSTLPEAAAKRIGNADIVVINKTILTAETLKACPNLKFISVIGTGYNTIDTSACKDLGIKLSNVPSYGNEAISQMAIALLLELTNRVGYHDGEVRRGRKNTDTDWCFWDYSVMELENKTVGIIGLGRIGKITARILEAFGAKILAFDKYQDNSWESENRKYTDLDSLYASSDIIFMHCPLLEDNYHMINAESISKMKDGVIFINNSRGALMDDKALADALNSGKIAGAGIDVLEKEPVSMDNPLLSAKNCYITPHISWAALDCRKRLQSATFDNIKAFIDGNQINVIL